MSFDYLATPYRAHPAGPARAVEEAAHWAAKLIDGGQEVYCPLTHTEKIAPLVTSAGWDSDFWMRRQMPFLRACERVVVGTHIEGWDQSAGIREEVGYALANGKWILDDQLEPLDDERLARIMKIVVGYPFRSTQDSARNPEGGA